MGTLAHIQGSRRHDLHGRSHGHVGADGCCQAGGQQPGRDLDTTPDFHPYDQVIKAPGGIQEHVVRPELRKQLDHIQDLLGVDDVSADGQGAISPPDDAPDPWKGPGPTALVTARCYLNSYHFVSGSKG